MGHNKKEGNSAPPGCSHHKYLAISDGPPWGNLTRVFGPFFVHGSHFLYFSLGCQKYKGPVETTPERCIFLDQIFDQSTQFQTILALLS